jgi:hypothetical protein
MRLDFTGKGRENECFSEKQRAGRRGFKSLYPSCCEKHEMVSHTGATSYRHFANDADPDANKRGCNSEGKSYYEKNDRAIKW